MSRATTIGSMSLEDLQGRGYGPVSLRISPEKVAEYVAATGDDAERWNRSAPPSFAGALLFAIAPAFLAEVGESTRVLVHTDQSFTWHGPLTIGAAVEVAATVGRVRSRGGVSFVGFEATVTADGSVILESSSTFLMGAGPAAEPGPDTGEPEVTAGAGTPDVPPATEPVDGLVLGPMTRSASRLDLVRYAAASGDFNPIHFDHAAARAAGLDGVVVHGLLMAAWLAQLGAAVAPGDAPLAEMKVRFRSALRPAQAAEATATVTSAGPDEATLAAALSVGGADLVTATMRVRG